MLERFRQSTPMASLLALLLSAPAGMAATPEFVIEIRNHLFEPDVISIPADTKVKLVIFNRDPTPEEFESYELNREKVIMGGRKAIVFIGPLPPRIPVFRRVQSTDRARDNRCRGIGQCC